MDDLLMRSLMFVPAHNQKLLRSAINANADVLLFDVEDSVLPKFKQQARKNIKEISDSGCCGKLVFFVRINDRESGELLKDLHQLTIPNIAGFMYPKAKNGEDIYFFSKLLETIEYEKGLPIGTFKIIPLIETAGAIVNIKEICHSSSRIVAVAFGCEDYITDLCGHHDTDGMSIFYARSMIVNAAREANIKPIDTVHIDVHKLEDLKKNIKLARTLGFEGMLALSPKELSIIHKYFSPTDEEVLWAQKILDFAESDVEQGNGVSVKGNVFVGPPMVKRAKNIIAKNILIKAKSEQPLQGCQQYMTRWGGVRRYSKFLYAHAFFCKGGGVA